MAGQLINFTPKPQIITTSSFKMDGTQALETLGSSGKLSVLARIYSSTSAAATNVTITVQTALTPSANDIDWTTVGTTTTSIPASTDGGTVKVDVSDLLLRYVRWTYGTTTTPTPTLVAEVSGVLW